MNQPEVLQGGNSNTVIREGDSVLRRTGAWSPVVHHLLRYLTDAGFTESPVLIESSGDTERLSYLEGEVGHYPLKRYMQSDEIVIEAAKLLRRYHDLTQHFVIPPDATFQLPVEAEVPYEVICHNDFAPYNCVFRDHHLAGMIDFDVAAPGTRVWDVAYAVYRFAPLATPSHCFDMGWLSMPDQARRLRVFCDAYGLADRVGLISMVIKRLERLVEYINTTGRTAEHLPIYSADIAFITENQTMFTDAVTR